MTPQRAPWNERDLSLPGVRLHVRTLEAERPAVILLHGLSVDGSVWQGVGRRLSPPWALVAPDLRGHGLSDHPAAGYELADYARDIARLAERIADETGTPPSLLGHSLGALAALGAAAENPTAVSKLILVDPPLDGPRTLSSFLQRMLDARRRGDEATIRALILEQTPGLSEPVFRVYRQMWERVADGALEAVIHGDGWPPRVAAWYPRVIAPTLILQADPAAGESLGEATTDHARRSLRDVRIVIVAGASHNIHAVKPAEFARLTLELLG